MKSALAVLAAVLVAGVCHAEVFYDTADVVKTEPHLVRVSRPVQVCDEAASPSANANQASLAGSVIGGVLDGLAGHQVGQGKGNTTATIAGSIGGALLGNKVASGQLGGGNCHTETSQVTEQRGVKVTYQYQGHTFTAIAPKEPGATIHVQTTMMPVF